MKNIALKWRYGRNFTVAVSLVAIGALLLAPLGEAPASASAKHAKVVVATGSVTCTKITGTITYSPAVRHVGLSPETQTFTFKASHCTTTGSNVKHVSGGSVTGVMHRPTNTCAYLLISEPSTGTGVWTPKTIHSSRGTFSSYTTVANASGDVGFTIPSPGGTARVTGSFAGRNHGATSRATLYVNMTAGQFMSECTSPAGLSKQVIVGGTATFS